MTSCVLSVPRKDLATLIDTAKMALSHSVKRAERVASYDYSLHLSSDRDRNALSITFDTNYMRAVVHLPAIFHSSRFFDHAVRFKDMELALKGFPRSVDTISFLSDGRIQGGRYVFHPRATVMRNGDYREDEKDMSTLFPKIAHDVFRSALDRILPFSPSEREDPLMSGIVFANREPGEMAPALYAASRATISCVSFHKHRDSYESASALPAGGSEKGRERILPKGHAEVLSCVMDIFSTTSTGITVEWDGDYSSLLRVSGDSFTFLSWADTPHRQYGESMRRYLNKGFSGAEYSIRRDVLGKAVKEVVSKTTGSSKSKKGCKGMPSVMLTHEVDSLALQVTGQPKARTTLPLHSHCGFFPAESHEWDITTPSLSSQALSLISSVFTEDRITLSVGYTKKEEIVGGEESIRAEASYISALEMTDDLSHRVISAAFTYKEEE